MTDVRPATLDDVDLLARIAAAGFYDDPVLSWVFRDGARRLDQLTLVFTGMVHDMLPDWGPCTWLAPRALPSGGTPTSSTAAQRATG